MAQHLASPFSFGAPCRISHLTPRSRAQPARSRSQLQIHAGFSSGRWVLSDKETSKRYELEGRRIVLGRKAQEGVDVVIDGSSVSGMHCELNIGTNSITITDLKSTNGTVVNGRNIGRGGKMLIRDGDSLELGDVEFLVTCEREAPLEQKSKPKVAEPERALIRTGGLELADIKLGPKLAGGSFGTVFRGEWKGKPVVLKTANRNIENAAQLLFTEYQINERVAKEAPGACAEFIGAIEVSKEEAGASYAGKLTEGLWLVWKDQGNDTLEAFLQRPTFAKDLAAALGVGGGAEKLSDNELEWAVVVTVMEELFQSLEKLHKIGIVHRDIKPSNMLIDAANKKIVLIDLGGAAACLGEPISYEPGEGAYDPLYAPPEKYLLQKQSPQPNAAIAQMLWRSNSPDLFDTYCAGMVLLRMALPPIRTEKSFKGFWEDLTAAGSIPEWRERNGAATGGDDILAEYNGAGWNLVFRLTNPPRSAKGGRMTAAEALQHPFFK